MKKLLVLFFCVFVTFSNLGHAHSPVGFVIQRWLSHKAVPEQMEIVFGSCQIN